MGGSEAPYIYQPMQTTGQPLAYPYSDFNPKAVTQAHYASLAERAERQRLKTHQEGKSLINFNQHPDSYMIVSTQNVNYEPMPPSTKKAITATRWVQFVLRCFQEIVALGLLVCVVCLKMDLNAVGWISRAAPAWDVLITLYGIYHLLRPAKNRTPYSSASYHFFALFMDTGMVPFYVFIALCANQSWNEEPGVDGRWTSFFNAQHTTTMLIFGTFIGGAIAGGLHVISICFDLYLVVMFRRIARLPPDMNPLEDNLTSRPTRASRHKYKNSEATLTSSSTDDMSEKKQHHLSGSTLSVDRQSRISAMKEPETRAIPFGHSRMNADTSFSPHNPETARLSRQQFEDVTLYAGSHSARNSRINLNGDRPSRSRPNSPSKHASMVENIQERPVSSRPGTRPAPTGDIYNRHPITTVPNPVYSSALVKSNPKQNLLKDNWYVFEQDANSDTGDAHHRDDRRDSFDPQPLRMNPPTPTMIQDENLDPEEADSMPYKQHRNYEPLDSGVARTATVASHTTETSSIYSESAPSLFSGRPNNSTPKRKNYGDLIAATRGVRGTAYSKLDQNLPPSPEQPRTSSPSKREGRVISRTGVDIPEPPPHNNNNYATKQSSSPYRGLRGRRDVSGKIAEEGRGGGGGRGWAGARSNW